MVVAVEYERLRRYILFETLSIPAKSSSASFFHGKGNATFDSEYNQVIELDFVPHTNMLMSEFDSTFRHLVHHLG